MVNMARKLGDFGVGLVILFFLFSGLTYIFVEMDSGLGVSSVVTTDLASLETSLDDVNDLNVQLAAQMDNATELAPTTQENQLVLLEKRGSSTGGVMNLFSKNILVRFINLTSNKLSLPTPVVWLFLTLSTLVITLLFVRFFFGEGKT